jgi:hypothetical protein
MPSERTHLLTNVVLTPDQRQTLHPHYKSAADRHVQLPYDGPQRPPRKPSPAFFSRRRVVLIVTMSILLLVVIAFSGSGTVSSVLGGPAPVTVVASHPSYEPVTPKLNLDPAVAHSLAQYAAWYPVDDYRAPPIGCEVDQVNIVRCLFHLHHSMFSDRICFAFPLAATPWRPLSHF